MSCQFSDVIGGKNNELPMRWPLSNALHTVSVYLQHVSMLDEEEY